ncbi:phosphopantetheine-binding protein [Streptomyces sp. NPDC001770]
MSDSSTPRTDDVITAMEEIYHQIKRIRRDLRREDRIVQDLEVDSLAALELLLALEERFGVHLVDNLRAAQVPTVGALADLIGELRAEQGTPAPRS